MATSMGISLEKTFQSVNEIRKQNGLRELKWNNALADAALARAKEMYETKQWSHNLNGKHIDAYVGNKYDYDLLGENLARKFKNSDNMVKAWQKSETHNKNILQKDFHETGIGTFGNVTVQVFGRLNMPSERLPSK